MTLPRSRFDGYTDPRYASGRRRCICRLRRPPERNSERGIAHGARGIGNNPQGLGGDSGRDINRRDRGLQGPRLSQETQMAPGAIPRRFSE
jgi:hypothetical protein